MQYPSVRTKLVVLLGEPLGHTFSPVMHNRVFEKLGMDFCYMPVEVSADNLKTVFSGLTKMNVAGFNVTIPHKIHIMDYLDELDPLAEVIGAVNTICLKNGATKGYNTDGIGFLTSLETSLNMSIEGKNVFILGCGGGARAIAMTLASNGAGKVFLCNRTREKAEALAAEINDKIRKCADVVLLNRKDMSESVGASDILINATSVGMHPDVEGIPIEEDLLFPELAVVDIVYNPRMTRLLQAAERKGCRILGGLGMLVYQGAEAFKLWTGVTPPADEMFDAIEKFQKKRLNS